MPIKYMSSPFSIYLRFILFLLQVLAKLCRLLGDDFLIYVDDLMPSLIQSAQNKINKEVNRRYRNHFSTYLQQGEVFIVTEIRHQTILIS